VTDDRSKVIQLDQRKADKLFLSIGTAYGLIFGLGFALLAWGYDALLLNSSSVDLAWMKLLLGLPLAVIISSLAGRFATLFPSVAVPVALWATAGALLGIVAGRVPFDGGNLTAWLADRRLWGTVVFPYGSSAATRTAVVAVIGAGLGAAVGAVEHLATGWAWDRVTPKGKISGQVWTVLLVCLPLTLPIAWATDDLINRPLRDLQQTIGELVEITLAGASEQADLRGLNYISIERHREQLSEQYTVYLVEYDLDSYSMGRVDVAFDNGFALRCMATAGQVGYCGPVSDTYQGWMDDLIHAGLSNEQNWLVSPRQHSLTVEDTVLVWLHTHSDQLSETYEVTRTSQQGGWIFMSARFDTGFEMVCRFHGAEPVIADQCMETSR
jgi:hypothetical protein